MSNIFIASKKGQENALVVCSPSSVTAKNDTTPPEKTTSTSTASDRVKTEISSESDEYQPSEMWQRFESHRHVVHVAR